MQKRLLTLKEKMAENNVEGLLISSVPNIIYLTGYSGFSEIEREAFLLVTQKKQYIFTDGRYSTSVKKQIPQFKLVETTSKKTFVEQLHHILTIDKIQKLYYEKTHITVFEYEKLGLKPQKSDLFLVEKIRGIKTKDELKAIENACILGDKTFTYLQIYIKPGITEKELAFKLQMFIKKNNADISFPPIVAFGKNTAVPHHQTSDQRLATRDIILLDFGVKINNYCSDMTRTLFVGKASDKQRKMYGAVLQAQEKAFEFVESVYSSSERRKSRSKFSTLRPRSGRASSNNKLHAADVDHVARNYIAEQDFPTIPHSLGHGIGIEVHESPNLSPNSLNTLQPGMVFSLEPGIYIPGFGGVRIEDLVVLEKNGPRFITRSQKSLIEL